MKRKTPGLSPAFLLVCIVRFYFFIGQVFMPRIE